MEGVAEELKALMGETLGDGRFVISGVLGRGSQGDTLEAVDKKNGCTVAIKRFMVRGARSWKEVELAEREARVLSGLDHPLLPHAIAHFEHDGALYLVMEKIEGRDLRKVDRLTPAQVIDFLHDAAEVLGYLHSRTPPVIHRDIKPGNVIARPASAHPHDPEGAPSRQRYVLVDFGSVRDQLRPAGGSTVVGTFGYMAAEQFQGRAFVGSDVYAVGATALRMLTGVEPEKLPHRGLAIDVDAAVGPQCDPRLRWVLRAMLEPDPDKRPSALAPLLAQLPRIQAAVAAVAPKPTSQAAAGLPAQPGRPQPGEGRAARRARRREAKRRRRAERQADRRARQHVWPWPLRIVMLLGLSIAQLVVTLSLGVMVPLLLTVLSLVFGRQLRVAAGHARSAAWSTRQALGRARRAVSTTVVKPAIAAQRKRQRMASRGDSEPPRKRVEVAATSQRVASFQEGAAQLEEELAQAEYEAEQAVHEAMRDTLSDFEERHHR